MIELQMLLESLWLILWISMLVSKTNLLCRNNDGAAVMSGHIGGVQAQVRQHYPFAYFVHCAAHRLNLVLCQSASSISPVKVFFVNIGAFCTFTSNAPKRKAFLTSHHIH